MASRIITKKGSGAPLASDLVHGELAVDTVNKRLYTENAGGTIIELGTAPSTIDINAGTIDGTVIGGSSAAAGTFTTLTASGEITANGGIALGDNDVATFGDGDDLKIYHTGSQNYIEDAGTGNLNFKSNGNNFNFLDGSDNVVMQIDIDSETTLYHNTSAKLATTSTGIDVTGTVTADGLTVEGSGLFDFGNAQVEIKSLTPRLIFNDDSAVGAGSDKFIIQAVASQSNGDYEFVMNNDQTSSADVAVAKFFGNGDISFYEDTGTTAKFFWDASAESLGIGTSSLSRPLHVNAAGTDGTQIQVQGTTDSAGIKFKPLSGDEYEVQANTSSDWFVYNRTDAAYRLLIDGSGNVGIGTSSPSGKLTISEAAGFNAPTTVTAANTYLQLGSADYATNGKFMIGFGYTDGATNTHSPAYMGFDMTSSSGDTKGDLTFFTRDVTTDTAPTERMRIDSNGRVGIGVTPDSNWSTASSYNTLQLRNSSLYFRSSSPELYIANNHLWNGSNWQYLSTNTAAMYGLTNNNHIWSYAASGTAGTNISYSEAMRIDSSGNVGIGTSSPSNKLHVQTSSSGATPFSTSPLVIERSDVNLISMLSANDTDQGILFGDVADNDIGGLFYLHASNAMTFRTNTAERMRIDSSGNLLVGQTSPDSNSVGIGLLASGTAYAVRDGSAAFLAHRKSSDGNIMEFLKDNSTVGSIGTLNSALTIGTGDTGVQFNADTNAIMPHNISTGANVDASIDIGYSSGGTNRRFKDLYLSGKVLAGNTTGTTGGFDCKANIGYTGTTTQYGLGFKPTTDTTYPIIFANAANSAVGSVYTTATATAYNTSSDYRLKENVVSMDNASDRVLALNPVRFNFIADPDKTVDGFLAHEAQAVVPEAVHGVKDEVDDEGNPVYQGIDQSKLVPLLTKALQEALERIAVLESKVGA